MERGGYDLTGLEQRLHRQRRPRCASCSRNCATRSPTLRPCGPWVSASASRTPATWPNVSSRPAFPPRAVSAETSAADRATALDALRDREINILFAVDLFNEGLDIPEVDTVLFLRPTESATVFLQQLGRGLRLTGKTVLDRAGLRRAPAPRVPVRSAVPGADRRWRRKALQQSGRGGLPVPALGQPDRARPGGAGARVGEHPTAVAPRWAALVSEVRAHPDNRLASYLDASGRGLEDVLKSNVVDDVVPRRRQTRCGHRASRDRAAQAGSGARACRRPSSAAAAYRSILDGTVDMDSPTERRLAAMLFFSLWPNGGGFDSAAAGLDVLAGEAVADEMRQVDRHRVRRRRVAPMRWGASSRISPRYRWRSTHVIPARRSLLRLGWASRRRGHQPPCGRSGVVRGSQRRRLPDHAEEVRPRLLADHDVPRLRVEPELFHWESQSTTSVGVADRAAVHQSSGTGFPHPAFRSSKN